MQLNSAKYNICPSVKELVHLITAAMKNSFLISVSGLVSFGVEEGMTAGLGITQHSVLERHGKTVGNAKALEDVTHHLRPYKDLHFSCVKGNNYV